MAALNFGSCLTVVLKEEGGYVNNPEDPGGATNHGVTQATWQTFVGKNKVVTAADIKALTEEDVIPLYRVFWKGCAGEYLPVGVDLATFDWCVNSGVSRGNRGLQHALGVRDDGLVGPVTLTAAAVDPAATIDAICEARLDFLKALPKWATFGHGWTNRVEAIRASAKAMLSRVPA